MLSSKEIYYIVRKATYEEAVRNDIAYIPEEEFLSRIGKILIRRGEYDQPDQTDINILVDGFNTLQKTREKSHERSKAN
jgi:hypothetical protein